MPFQSRLFKAIVVAGASLGTAGSLSLLAASGCSVDESAADRPWWPDIGYPPVRDMRQQWWADIGVPQFDISQQWWPDIGIPPDLTVVDPPDASVDGSDD